jgi:hypothetical protein
VPFLWPILADAAEVSGNSSTADARGAALISAEIPRLSHSAYGSFLAFFAPSGSTGKIRSGSSAVTGGRCEECLRRAGGRLSNTAEAAAKDGRAVTIIDEAIRLLLQRVVLG